MRKKTRCWSNIFGLFVGLIALDLLFGVAIGGSTYFTTTAAAEQNRTGPNGAADVSQQTILHAFFERPDDPSCFAFGRLFALREDGVELVYPIASLAHYPKLQAGVFWGNAERWNSDFWERVSMNFSDQRCLILLRVYEEIMRDGRWIKLRPARPAEARATSTDEHLPVPTDEPQKPTDRLTGGLSDILGRLQPPPSADALQADRIDISRAKFADNPETGCLRGEGLFAITPSGLQIVFPEPHAKLPFDVEQLPPTTTNRSSLFSVLGRAVSRSE